MSVSWQAHTQGGYNYIWDAPSGVLYELPDHDEWVESWSPVEFLTGFNPDTQEAYPLGSQ